MSTKTIKKYFCDACGHEVAEDSIVRSTSAVIPVIYTLVQHKHCDGNLEMDLCWTCHHILTRAIDTMYGVTEEIEDEVDEEEDMARQDYITERLEKAEERLALIENAWVEASNLAEVKGPIEEGILAMARELYSHRCPWA